jgi:hypothetical protein
MRWFTVGTLLAVVLLAAGCGGGEGGGGGSSSKPSGEAPKPAAQVVHDAAKAAKAASSVRMSGQIAEPGRKIGIDLSFVRDKGATGTFTLDGAPVNIVLIGNRAYMRAGPAFWKQFSKAKGVGQLLAGKWLKFPANDEQLGSLMSVASDKALCDKLATDHGKLVNRGATTYKGQSVVAIYDTQDKGTLYVSASGTPYPVALVKTRGRTGTVAFDNWNQPVKLTAPKGAVDISKLHSGSRT